MVPESRLIETAAQGPSARAAVRPKPRLRTFYVRWTVTVAVAVLAVSRFAAAAQVGYAIDRTQAELQVARASELSLEGQVAALTSAGRLTAVAAKLKLAPAPAVMAVTVPAGAPAARSGSTRAHAGPGGVSATIGALIESITRAVTGM